ncbi:hypothetical protein [Colwellia sp. E150_009]
MDWYTAAQVTATNGSDIVVVNSGEYINAIRDGDGLRIDGFDEVEILETYTDVSTDEETIKLKNNWPNTSQSLVPATVIPHAVHFNTAAQALVDAKTKVFAQLASFFAFGAQASGTVTFSGVGISDPDITIRSIPQYKTDLDALESSATSSVAYLAAVDAAINGVGGLSDQLTTAQSDLASIDSTLQGYVSTVSNYRDDVSGWHSAVDGWNTNVNSKYTTINGWYSDINGFKTDSESARDLAEQYRDEAEDFKNQAGAIVGGNYVSQSTTVNGKALSDNITLSKIDIGLSDVDNTSDLNKPISTATQSALDDKADSSDISNVDNTSDLDKPVSTATQAALDDKADSSDLSALQTQLDKVRKLALAGL